MGLANRNAPRLAVCAALALLVAATALLLTSAPADAAGSRYARLAAYKKAFNRWDRATDPLSLDIYIARTRLDDTAPDVNRQRFASLARRTRRARRVLLRIRTPRSMRRLHRSLAVGVRRIAADLSAVSTAEERGDRAAAMRASEAVIDDFERTDRTELRLRARLRRLLAASRS